MLSLPGPKPGSMSASMVTWRHMAVLEQTPEKKNLQELHKESEKDALENHIYELYKQNPIYELVNEKHLKEESLLSILVRKRKSK